MRDTRDLSLSFFSFALAFGAAVVFAYAAWFDIPKDSDDLRRNAALISVFCFVTSGWFGAKLVRRSATD